MQLTTFEVNWRYSGGHFEKRFLQRYPSTYRVSIKGLWEIFSWKLNNKLTMLLKSIRCIPQQIHILMPRSKWKLRWPIHHEHVTPKNLRTPSMKNSERLSSQRSSRYAFIVLLQKYRNFAIQYIDYGRQDYETITIMQACVWLLIRYLRNLTSACSGLYGTTCSNL